MQHIEVQSSTMRFFILLDLLKIQHIEGFFFLIKSYHYDMFQQGLYSVVQCSSVWSSAVQFGGVQCLEPVRKGSEFLGLQCLQCEDNNPTTAPLHSTLHYSTMYSVQYSVQYIVQCTVQYTGGVQSNGRDNCQVGPGAGDWTGGRTLHCNSQCSTVLSAGLY